MPPPLPPESMMKPPPCFRVKSACEINARFRAVFCPCEINSDSWGQRGAVGTNDALSLRAFFSQTPDSRKEAPTAFVKNRTQEAELGVEVCHSIYFTRVLVRKSKATLKDNIFAGDQHFAHVSMQSCLACFAASLRKGDKTQSERVPAHA
jgi:hypothetical protein